MAALVSALALVGAAGCADESGSSLGARTQGTAASRVAGAGTSTSSDGTPQVINLTIGATFAGGSWDVVAGRLAAEYSQRLPGVHATSQTNENLEEAADTVQRGDWQLAIQDVETAYVAFSTGTPKVPQPHADLRAMAVLFSTAVHVVARTNAGITSISDFKGKRVGMGAAGSSTERAARLILGAHDVPIERITPAALTAAESAKAIREGRLDAAFIYAPFQNLYVADLTGADLSGSRLTRVNLEGAKLEGVNFKGALMPDGREHP